MGKSEQHIREAMFDELDYLCREVIVGVKMEDALADPDHVLVSGRWVNCNKADSQSPKCRGRYVAQEANPGGESDPSFYSATPPLEAKRMLLSRCAEHPSPNDIFVIIPF